MKRMIKALGLAKAIGIFNAPIHGQRLHKILHCIGKDQKTDAMWEK